MTHNTLIAPPDALLCDEFPYVLWPVGPGAVYSLQALRGTIPREHAVQWVRHLAGSFRRKCVVVFGSTDCVYIAADGSCCPSSKPPTGGIAFRSDIAIPDPPRPVQLSSSPACSRPSPSARSEKHTAT